MEEDSLPVVTEEDLEMAIAVARLHFGGERRSPTPGLEYKYGSLLERESSAYSKYLKGELESPCWDYRKTSSSSNS
jgi:hypothetical protein